MARELKPCGTHAAYRRHLKKKEDPCEACREANRVANEKFQQDYTERRRNAGGALCGTSGGYKKHRARDEEPCGPCGQAHSDYMSNYHFGRSNKGSLPREAPENAHKAPCTDPRNNYVWDERGIDESKESALERHQLAAALCNLQCPVIEHCKKSKETANAGGVWAGIIPSK